MASTELKTEAAESRMETAEPEMQAAGPWVEAIVPSERSTRKGHLTLSAGLSHDQHSR